MPRRTQDLLFTLYGDYVLDHEGGVWVGSLIELLDCFGATAQAVRSTLSRMSARGWLHSRKAGHNSYYSLTAKAIASLKKGRQRYSHPNEQPWDGKWRILVCSIPDSRSHLHARLRERLVWMGFGLLNQATWVSPRDLEAELGAALDELKIRKHVEYFVAEHVGFSPHQVIVDRCWNLKALNRSYADFLKRYKAQYEERLAHPELADPRADFITRFKLTREFRAIPYADPNLPQDLLPAGWLGDDALSLATGYHALLTEAAEAYVDDVLPRAPIGKRKEPLAAS